MQVRVCDIFAARQRLMRTLSFRIIIFASTLVLLIRPALGAAPATAFTDNIAYNVGSTVQLKVVFSSPGESLPASVDIKATLRYAGDSKALLDQYPVASAIAITKDNPSTGYRRLWTIPLKSQTGRYEIDLTGEDAKTHQTVFSLPGAASFVVYKKLVQIDAIKLDKTFYTSGDPVSAEFTIANLTRRPLSGLRVEFSNRYWPWIAGPADAARASVVTIDKNLSLAPGETKKLHAPNVETADAVKEPATHQYGVVVWDHARKEVLAIGFSPLAFFNPPGVAEPRPYPGNYIHSTLSAVEQTLSNINPTSYRHFYRVEKESPAIQFDGSHTMFATGEALTAAFVVTNPTRETWKRMSRRYRFLKPDGTELSHDSVGPIDLPPGAWGRMEVESSAPAQTAGLYHVEVEVTDEAGNILASQALELAVNPLPKSILIFCAHEDDEGGYSGLARAAVENHIPIHYVYFTSGDAGSCDLYYQHSCGPADAFNFGRLRMDEVRASLGHIGISRDDILFVGLPDGGSGQIWYDHVKPTNPFLDPLLATDHAPYEGLVAPNVPYARESVVETVEALIRKYQPDVIATPHPGIVGHIDHIVDNYFVVKALQALAREGAVLPTLPVLVDQVRDPKTQPPTPYHYNDVTFFVSGDAAALAQEAGWFYQSQGGNRQEGNIRSFDKLPRKEELRQIIDWNEHEGWNEKRAAAVH